MAAAQHGFASLDGTVFGGTEDSFRPDPSKIARRSVSIFSRRGSETPEPALPFIAQAAMGQAVKPMTERQRGWIGRSKSICSSSPKSAGSPKSPKLPKGTILNAVPPAKTIKMSALEEEMATSPNDEILSAISDQSPTQAAFAAQSNSTPTPALTSLWSRSTASLTSRSKSQKQRDAQTRIGVWVDGVVHWDEEAVQERAQWQEQIIEEDLGFTPLHPRSVAGTSTGQARPTLSVVIPDKEPLVNSMTVSTIVQLRPRRPVVPVAPTGLVSTVGVPAPAIHVEVPREISLVDSMSPRPTLPLEPPNGSARLEVVESPDSHKQRSRNSRSSASSLSDVEHSDASVSSKRSSATSLDEVANSTPDKSKRRISRKPLPKDALSIDTKACHGDEEIAPSSAGDVNKPLPPSPIPQPDRLAPSPPQTNVRKVKSTRSARGAAGRDRLQLGKPLRASRSLTQLDLVDEAFMRSSPYASTFPEPASPTLSQAEYDLKSHLLAIAEDMAAVDDQRSVVAEPSFSRVASIRRGDSVRSVMQPPERAPTLPRKSRKREWRARNRHVAQLALPTRPERRRSDPYRQTIPDDDAENVKIFASGVRRSVSAVQLSANQLAERVVPQEEESFTPELPRRSSRRAPSPQPPPRIVIDDGLIVVHGPVTLGEEGSTTPIAVASAEEVLLNILSSLNSVDDLFNTASINKGMYRVYKENEMHLIRTVLFNQSPAAWEYMEWSPPSRNDTTSSKASSQLEHTPLSYIRCYKRDLAAIRSLKTLIFEHCQTFIRRETAFALSTPSHPNAQRFEDAFWRIWCFCKIFGYGKNREEDVTGQLDWLKGGILANNQNAAATVNMNLEFEMSSVLLNAPDFFASGNGNGLNAQQLYDMTEIWTCLSALLQSYQGRLDLARDVGVFDTCDVADGDLEQEEQMLEEWTHHLMTLGPSVILEMAIHAGKSSLNGFDHAKVNGWTKWAVPLCNGTRNTFLKEPVSRLYEERVAAAAQKLQNPREQEKKEMSRKRVATLAAEIRLARQSSQYKRLPLIDMKNERAMSVLQRRNSAIAESRRSSLSSVGTKHYMSPIATTPSTPNFSRRSSVSPRPMSPGQFSPRRDLQPLVEDRVHTFNRMSLSNFEGIAEDTSERAVKKIVDMGFSPVQAREALRVTDMGDGLRVDRAVDLLLRQRI